MKGDPALVVRLVDASSVLHQERHHVHVVIYACLGERRKRSKVRRQQVSLGLSIRVYHVYDACNSGMVCVVTPLLLHSEGKCTVSDRLPHAFRVVWGFWLLERSQKCLHIAGVPGIPHGTALLMEGCSGCMLLFYTRGKRTQQCVLSNDFHRCDKTNL